VLLHGCVCLVLLIVVSTNVSRCAIVVVTRIVETTVQRITHWFK